MVVEGGIGIEPTQMDSRFYATIYYAQLIYRYIDLFIYPSILFDPSMYLLKLVIIHFLVHVGLKYCYLTIPIVLIIL